MDTYYSGYINVIVVSRLFVNKSGSLYRYNYTAIILVE